MKKQYLIAILMTVILVSSVAASMLISANDKAKEPLDKITFIHYKDGTMKEVGKSAQAPTCYKLLGVKWSSLPVSYVINPSSSGLKEGVVTSAISASAETWDAATSKELLNNVYTIDSSATLDDGTVNNPVDYQNEYVFGYYSDKNVIAVTVIWYTRYGRQIVDYDVLFNTQFTWGDATINPTVMDLQNIATHETGHGLGLDDIYQNSCSAVTMYGYSRYGETSKRTLEQPDITGLQKMYGV